MSLLSAFLKHAKFSVAFGRLGTAFVIAAALSAGALTSNCALAASDDGWFSAIDAGRGEKKAGPHVTVNIIAEKTSLTPQAVNRFAVRFRHQEGWHTYWKMPGDAGLPPEFTFTLSPSELKASAPLFPLPERTVTSGLITFGYGGETLFPFNVELPRGASGRAQIALHVEYLACKDMCVPESADVKFSIPIDIKYSIAAPNPITPSIFGVPASNFVGAFFNLTNPQLLYLELLPPPKRVGVVSCNKSYLPYKIPIPVGPHILCPEKTIKSRSKSFTSTR